MVSTKHAGQVALAAAVCLLLPVAAAAQTATAEQVCMNCYVTSLSADGRRATGMMADNYETYLWKAGKGAVRLGRSTADTLGVTGGQPAISADGKKIASTILSDDGLLATSGTWKGGAWTQITPPLPPDAGAGDSQDSSVWNMSADGKTVVGLYWRYGHSGGTAHGFTWTAKTDMVGLPTAGGDSRVNGVNANGSVLTGWESDPNVGTWQAMVWVNGAKTLIGSAGNWSMGQAVNPAGTIIVGQDYDTKAALSSAAIWRWTGSEWRARTLGVLKGTDPIFGSSLANAVSQDGMIVGGGNVKQWGPGGSVGFIWTPTGKLQSANDYFAQFGYSNPGFTITNVMTMTPDGKHFGIIEEMSGPPFLQRSAVLSLVP